MSDTSERAGLTDREICGQLYLSPKTVEFHLGRVYRKLGVRGRTELARRLPGRQGRCAVLAAAAGKLRETDAYLTCA